MALLCPDTPRPVQVDVEIKYEDLDDIDDEDESGSDVDAVRFGCLVAAANC